MYELDDFYFDLPKEQIAQHPIEDRAQSRLLVMKKDGRLLYEHFYNIGNFLKKGDCLVINETRVMPARLFGLLESGGSCEFLLLKRMDGDRWEIICKPARRLHTGKKAVFGDGLLKAEILDELDEGKRIVQFSYEGIFEQILDSLGQMPIPPYITEKLVDKERYQTVYAKHMGSVAAPTAGLHFTNELLENLQQDGINIARLTLHVGLGTFRPVKTSISEHKMHEEYYELSEETAQTINNTVKNGGRIIAVGTTSCRTLETLADEKGLMHSGSGLTDIFIRPGYDFKVVNGLITNFHLPCSTLIMLVSALAGYDNVMNAYKIAVSEGYRFYSFGDCMAIL